jgi:hypothetical protein
MVNVIIYLKTVHNPKTIVESLLNERLVASASIDYNNVLYELSDLLVSEEHYNVITAQSKSLLFSDIVEFVQSKVGLEVLVISTPIVGSNRLFDSLIREKTIPI